MPESSKETDCGPVVLPDLPIIESHHHLWTRDGTRYLLEEFAADLANSGHRVEATVYMECGAMYRNTGPLALRPVGEAEFVAEVANRSSNGHFGSTKICAAFVGAADLTLGNEVDKVLDALALASEGRLRGIRGAVAWDRDASINPGGRVAAPGLLMDSQFRRGVARLAERSLVFDAWQYHPQLSELCDLADEFPELPIVVNHCGGPLGAGSYAVPETFGRWKALVREVASRPHTLMKLGGMARRRCGFNFEDWAAPPTAKQLAAHWAPYIETCIELFGPQRCMFESNFPPDGVAGSYRTVWNALKLTGRQYTPSEQLALFNGTARRVYRIPGSPGQEGH